MRGRAEGLNLGERGGGAGAVSALLGPREALLLSVQLEAGHSTAFSSEAGLIRGLTVTAEEAGKVVGACDVVAVAGPRDRGGLSTQRAEEGTVEAAGTRGGSFPMPDRAGVAGQDNPELFVSTTEVQLQLKQLI